MELLVFESDTLETDCAPSKKNWLRIKRGDPSLTILEVWPARDPPYWGPTIVDDAGIEELGRDIGKNTHLRELTLTGINDMDDVATRKFQLLCRGINDNKSIGTLSLKNGNHEFAGKMCQFLDIFLEQNSNLQSVKVMGGLHREGLRFLATPLMKRQNPLANLELASNTIDDDSVQDLALPMIENPTLTPKQIDLRGNTIGDNGCELIARLMHDSSCKIEDLDISYNHNITDYGAFAFANALVGNEVLKKLGLGGTSITTTGFAAIYKSLCNPTTINATYTSNHSLNFLGWFAPHSNPLLDGLQQSLEWNKNDNKKLVACQKVMIHHFSGDIRLEQFEGMQPELLIRILAFINSWCAQNDGSSYETARRSIYFQLIKSDPMICKIANHGPKKNGNGCKRRRL